MAQSKVNRILNMINNDPELLSLYEARLNYPDKNSEIINESKSRVPCPYYVTQSFQQGVHAYQFEIVVTSDGDARYTGRVF